MRDFRIICKAGSVCAPCMDRQASTFHRTEWRKRFKNVPDNGAPCPFGRPWGAKGDMRLPIIVSVVEERENLAVCETCSNRQGDMCGACESCGAKDIVTLARKPLKAGCMFKFKTKKVIESD